MFSSFCKYLLSSGTSHVTTWVAICSHEQLVIEKFSLGKWKVYCIKNQVAWALVLVWPHMWLFNVTMLQFSLSWKWDDGTRKSVFFSPFNFSTSWGLLMVKNAFIFLSLFLQHIIFSISRLYRKCLKKQNLLCQALFPSLPIFSNSLPQYYMCWLLKR